MGKFLNISLFLFFCFFSCELSAQGLDSFLTPSDSLNKSRRNAVIISETALAGAAYVALAEIWYADYPKSKFHFINDNDEWLQMDKVGHGFAGYHLARTGSELLHWSGMKGNERLIYGAGAGFVFLSAIEIFDGHSAKWGASLGDLGANAAGTALYVSQELLWKEQRIIPKFSFHTTPYANVRPDALGNSFNEQILKDYNGQTYWLSANPHSFFKSSGIPVWLNVAVGYGAEGMITGRNRLVNTVFLPESSRFRQYYLSLDVDLARIKTKSPILKTVFSVLNSVKIPAPTFEIQSSGSTKFHLIYF